MSTPDKNTETLSSNFNVFKEKLFKYVDTFIKNKFYDEGKLDPWTILNRMLKYSIVSFFALFVGAFFIAFTILPEAWDFFDSLPGMLIPLTFMALGLAGSVGVDTYQKLRNHETPVYMIATLGIIAIVVLTSATEPPAEWVEVQHQDWERVRKNYDVDLYVDKASISKSGNVITVSYLLDFHTAETKSFTPLFSSKPRVTVTSSRIYKSEFDCTAFTMNELGFSNFSGHMGSGKKGYSQYSSNKFRTYYKISDNIDYSIGKSVCEIK